MVRLFPRAANTWSRLIVFGFVFFVALLVWLGYLLERSPYASGVGIARNQVVPFSHEHHVGALGIDCRYCHTSVETSAFAGIPPTETCMHCHSQIWSNSTMLEPVRASYRTGEPLHWERVHNLPQYVYFNHSIHVNKGVGCATCHGPVNRMPLTWQAEPLTMQWCLNCHRNPEQFVRPREEVFNMDWKPEGDQIAIGRRLVKEYKIKDVRSLTNCSTCHF